ncbi:uncharacterized protein LOC144628942 isoform X2 [Oculina patagonica]
MVFSRDKVHILPGYPKQLAVDPLVALLAFYLQFPQGLSDNIVRKEVVKAILESDVSSIEESMNGTIISVQSLVSTTDPTEKSDEESKPTTAIIIGACVGGVLLLVIIIALVLACKRSLRSIKQSSKKSVDVTSYNNDAYVSNSNHITSEGQVTEMKNFEFYAL